MRLTLAPEKTRRQMLDENCGAFYSIKHNTAQRWFVNYM